MELFKQPTNMPNLDLHLLLSSQSGDNHNRTTLMVNKDYIELDELVTQTKSVLKLSENTRSIPVSHEPFPCLVKLAVQLLTALAFHLRSMSTYENRTLHPTVVLFNQLADSLFVESAFDPSWVLNRISPLPVVVLNTFLATFRAAVNTPHHHKRLKKFQRAVTKNERSAKRYVARLFERYSRLLVVRVDLSYNESSKLMVTAQQARADRERLLLNAKTSKLFQHLVGYIWKLEYGSEKRYHYHLLFFFNGAHVREDVTLGRLIGEYWTYKITAGTGCYYNCNADKTCYQKLGIGMVSYADTALREGLLIAVGYLTKMDEWIRLALPEQGRSFGKGELSPRSETQRGRPRQFVNGNLSFCD